MLLLSLTIILSQCSLVASHASMIMPPPRNAIDSELALQLQRDLSTSTLPGDTLGDTLGDSSVR